MRYVYTNGRVSKIVLPVSACITEGLLNNSSTADGGVTVFQTMYALVETGNGKGHSDVTGNNVTAIFPVDDAILVYV